MVNNKSNPKKLKTLVFSGPTLSGLKSYRDSLVDFDFHPPVVCGNLIEAYREGYRSVVLIDGFFETVASVWHKEIMYFIERGGTVVGCSSMGALRGAELERYGMIGFGKIFEQYSSGILTDDDEVTVGHLGKGQDFQSLTDAMVNIRATVQVALEKGILSELAGLKIIARAKSEFYKNRSLRVFTDELLLEDPSIASFSEYLQKNGLIDQKKNDAIELLNNFKDILSKHVSKNELTITGLNASYPLRVIHLSTITDAPKLDSQVLALEFRQLKLTRFLGIKYELLKRLAISMAWFTNLREGTPGRTLDLHWLPKAYIGENIALEKFIVWAVEQSPEYYNSDSIPKTVRLLCLEFGIKLSSLINETTGESTLIYLIGLFHDTRFKFDQIAQRTKNDIKKGDALALSLQKKYNLTSQESIEKFLKEYQVDSIQDSALDIVRIGMQLSIKELRANCPFLNGWGDEYWFELAVQISGINFQLAELSKAHNQNNFIENFVSNIEKLSELDKTRFLISHSLPTNLLNADSIKQYFSENLI